MAIPFHALTVLVPLMRDKDVLSLGYPDILASSADVEKLCGYKPTKFTNANEWHKTKEPPPDSQELFERIGANLTVVDFTADHGMEKIADLNHPQELGKFDVVIDPGTLEHCFNIGQAWMNAANAVKVGGYVFHTSPMTMLNHGFYNLSPTVFYDFYTQNGWEIKDMKVIPTGAPDVQITKRFTVQVEHIIRALVLRKNDGVLKFPIQTKYLEKMEAKK